MYQEGLGFRVLGFRVSVRQAYVGVPQIRGTLVGVPVTRNILY